MPAVSIVVPNYNHARFLRQRIDTILAQTFQDFELILLDDCSTDDSRSILSSYASDPRVRLDFNDKNSGSTFKQWNKGVRLARCEYVWIAESDDYADPSFLERLVAILASDPNIVVAWCRSWSVTEGGQLAGLAETRFLGADQDCWSVDYCRDGREVCRNYMIRSNIMTNASAILFRKAAYQRVGGADETMRLSGDWKLWASLLLEGKVAYVSETLNYYRFHDSAVRNTLDFPKIVLPEWFDVSRWLEDRVSAPPEVLRKACHERAQNWVPAVLSMHVPWKTKREILRRVRALDPHPFRSSIRPVFATLQRKFLRHWNSLPVARERT